MISVASFLLTLSLIGFYQLISNHFQGTRYDANGINLVGLLDLKMSLRLLPRHFLGLDMVRPLWLGIFHLFFISLFIFRRYLLVHFSLLNLHLPSFCSPLVLLSLNLPHQNNISQLFFPTKLVWNYYAAAPVYHHPLEIPWSIFLRYHYRFGDQGSSELIMVVFRYAFLKPSFRLHNRIRIGIHLFFDSIINQPLVPCPTSSFLCR